RTNINSVYKSDFLCMFLIENLTKATEKNMSYQRGVQNKQLYTTFLHTPINPCFTANLKQI
ncbi:MAG: hypothetical protein ACLFQO_12265, partial [Cyclobacteriaceae bacterium]